MSPTPAPTSPVSRHPATIGVLESLRAGVLVVAVSLVCASVAWFAALASQQAVSAVPVWAGTLVAAAAGLEVTGSFTLPPTLLTALLVLVLGQSFRRTRRALRVNVELTRTGRLPDMPYAFVLGIGIAVACTIGWIVLVGTVAGSATVSPLGSARMLTVLLLAGLIAWVRPVGRRADRRAQRRARAQTSRSGTAEAPVWQDTLTDWAETRWGTQWAQAPVSALRLTGRVWAGLGILAVLLLAVAAVVRRAEFAEVLIGYSDPLGAGVGLSVLQLLFLPTIALLALSWASGAGIWMAAQTLASPHTAFEGPVAGVPALALVPQDPPAWCAFLVVGIAAVGLSAAAARRTWAEALDWRTLALSGALLLLSTAAAALFCTGALGPDGLDRFGAPLLAMTALITGPVLLGVAGAWGMRAAADRS